MRDVLDAFWRAAAYCLHPRVIFLSALPLLISAALVLGLGWLYWESSVAAVRAALEQWSLVGVFADWMQHMGVAGFKAMLAPMLVVALAVPVIVLLSLLGVAVLMTPALVSLVAQRRFASLQRLRGAPWWVALAWSLGCMAVALVALALSLPLWLVPPLVLLLPPLIWGWLTYKVMSFDALADHASAEERRRIMREQRWPLLTMGVVCGYLGAAPSLLWALSAFTLVFAPLLLVLSVWLYTLVFAFSSLWFIHFALAALARLRLAPLEVPVTVVAESPALAPPPGSAPPLLGQP